MAPQVTKSLLIRPNHRAAESNFDEGAKEISRLRDRAGLTPSLRMTSCFMNGFLHRVHRDRRLTGDVNVLVNIKVFINARA